MEALKGLEQWAETHFTYVKTYDTVPTSYVNSKSKRISPGVHSLFSVSQLAFLYIRLFKKNMLYLKQQFLATANDNS